MTINKSRERNKIAQKKWRENNRERCLEKGRKYYAENKDKIKERKKKYTEKEVIRSRKKNLARYGIDEEILLRMKEEQNHCCAICGEIKKLVVDHNHTTGETRGLLCSNCNIVLGMAKENINILSKAIIYISSFGEKI